MLLRLIIGTGHVLVHISYGMTLDLSYFGIKRPLKNSRRNQTVISMCLTLGETILYPTTEIQLVLSSQCNGGTLVLSYRDSMYLRTTLVFLTALYKHPIYPSVESEAMNG